MEGKKLYLIQPQFSLFFEKRFLLLDPPPEPAPAPSPDPEPEPAPAPVAPEGDRAGVRRGAARERRKARGKAERTELKKEAPKLPTLPEAPSLDKDVFVGKVESREMQNQLDRLKINVKREDRTINGQKWDHSTGPGLQKIMKDLQDLDIYNDPNLNNKPFYDTMFAHLKAGVDFTF